MCCSVDESRVGAHPSLCGDPLLCCTPQHPVGCLATVSVHGNRGNNRPHSSSACTLQLGLNCCNQERRVTGRIKGGTCEQTQLMLMFSPRGCSLRTEMADRRRCPCRWGQQAGSWTNLDSVAKNESVLTLRSRLN